MPATQRMKVASEKHSKYINMRGNVPKSNVIFDNLGKFLQF
jgi:hypothetical protein